jgi:putative CocE/NonD family hydrolase
MRDQTRIAVDVTLPAGKEHQRLPVIVRQTRYYRGIDARRAFANSAVVDLPDNHAHTRRLFVAQGYAWVDVDVRGSGASFGTQKFPWSDDEVQDGHQVLDWIVAQPWCNGRLGALGISYDGTSAEHLAYTAHPALLAVAPMFSLFDVYADVAFPGGVHLAQFTSAWARFNRTLDDGLFGAAMARGMWQILRSSAPSVGWASRFASLANALTIERFVTVVAPVLDAMVVGIRATDDDPKRTLVRLAAGDHRDNVDVHASALRLQFRDDVELSERFPTVNIDAFSPHSFAHQVRRDLAVYSISGWRDGAYQRSATNRFATLACERSRLLLGPWCHGGKIYAAPGQPTREAAFALDHELLRWFDWILKEKDDGISRENQVHYFVTGEERWHSAAQWPPKSAAQSTLHTWYAHNGRTLDTSAPSRPDGDDLTVIDHTQGAGPSTRWNTLLGGFIRGDYPDRAERDKALLTYTSAPLEQDVTLLGHARVLLWVESESDDFALHVYLEQVDGPSQVHHVTEGVLRASHRESARENPAYFVHAPWRSHKREHHAPVPKHTPVLLDIELLPTAHRFARGSCIRLAIATADADHFATVGMARAKIRVLRNSEYPSRVEFYQ